MVILDNIGDSHDQLVKHFKLESEQVALQVMCARVEFFKHDRKLDGDLVESATFSDVLSQRLAARGGLAHEFQQLDHDLFIDLVVREAIDLLGAEGDELEAFDLVLDRIAHIVMIIWPHELAEDLERGLFDIHVTFRSDLGIKKGNTAMPDNQID